MAAAVDVAAAEQRDGLAVAEAHPAEDLVTHVVGEALPADDAPLRVLLRRASGGCEGRG